ncbi:2-deoxy-D-gluconate 3-dehydrogenase [Rhodococcus aetherivorans]|uniref:2-deoxy-D-gluconate 3-dehydrogenase n=1 Tax=Rhodococcus aetherivorans TaxID=191292 RepID=A0ABQ0YIP1_9NOCA|nr:MULTISPECIES: SDR family oxidoreductase [Rhodococcus]ETT24057.1 2-deoxy-D-gluconate 3-dehydrogenase [Rhodococcus rhodochrous ATCC 21198]NGP28929.1 SDR family oxidoreductase [Rhodococcus aetherivorans]PND49753.1 KR domain-containing protein [Rhodococcus sp. ENV425]WKW99263.1 SDR family oxidoreductase [Rhodococcus aetherivorans]GES36412.1 2-deoxy-D-gluconate 3-dehydrogenase [Rhodococcus aetherivorans]
MNAPVHTPVLDLFRLDGNAAIVTGASRGLGRALAIALAEAGADIVAVDIGELDQVAKEVRARGVRCATRTADLSGLTPESAAELFSWAKTEFPHPTILVNNAGIIRRGPATETTPSDWSAVLDLNLTTPFLLSQAFARSALDDNAAASIINIASVNSFQGGMEVPSYAASKHGILGLTRALANEWAAHHIRVNAIAPGYMETEFTAAHRDDPTRAENMLRRIPTGTWGRPEGLAGAVVFLASAASAYVTGTALSVDGGWLSR